jgi:hypothetical protein
VVCAVDVLVSIGKVIYGSQWMYFFFSAKKKYQKETPGCAFFYEAAVL